MQKYLYYFLLVFTLVTGFYLWLGWSQLLGSDYVYSLDDVYIHLAISKNFAEFGSWSINSGYFDSASSSILYTLLLSGCIKVFGESIYYPMFINVIFGYGTVYMVYRYFREFYGKTEMRWALGLLLPFCVLYVMVILGMEHSIHLFLMTIFIYVLKRNIENGFQSKTFLHLLICLFFIALVRFESLFLTSIVGFLLLIQKRWSQSLSVFLVGFLPIIIFGLISINNGGFFFPNSVLIKGKYPSDSGMFASLWFILKKGIILNLNFYKYIFFPIILIVWFWLRTYYKKLSWIEFIKNEFLSITIISVALMQTLFAELAYRYENYVMISLLLILIPVLQYFSSIIFKSKTFSLTKLISGGLIMMILLLSAYRVYFYHPRLEIASKNIQEQQVEMSRFINTYYKGQKVAANDIGAIAYFGQSQLLDLVGLGSTDIADFVIKHKNLPESEYNIEAKTFFNNYTKTHHQKIAVIYPGWFPDQIPDSWIPVMSWKITNNLGAARDTVVWYAVDPKEANQLRLNLEAFNLNPNIIVKIIQ